MFVDLISHVERSIHEIAHVLPAVDHVAQLPSAPTDAVAAARLQTMRGRQEEPDFQTELDRDIAWWRASRAHLLHATEDLRECIARELDA